VEVYTNNPGSTLNSSINNSVTSLDVVSAASFPTSGIFSILIGTEIMKVTAVSGTTFTVVRGQEGTSAASHTAGDAVDGTLTKRSMDQICADQVTYDIYANLPAAGKKGRMFVPSDGGIQLFDDGTNWNGWWNGQPAKPLDNSVFTWDNQSSCSLTQYGSNWTLAVTSANTGNPGFALRYKTAPSTPYTILMAFTPLFHIGASSAFYSFACGFRESSSGKLHSFMMAWNSSLVQMWSSKWTNSTSFSTDYTTSGIGRIFEPIPHYMYLKDDGTDRSFGVSYDGKILAEFDFTTSSDFLTPNQVWWGVREDSTDKIGMTMHSWREF
jgi:hypothetical protein